MSIKKNKRRTNPEHPTTSYSKKRVTNIELFKGKAEHAAYGPVLSKPFVRFESSLHSFLIPDSATPTRQTRQAAPHQRDKQDNKFCHSKANSSRSPQQQLTDAKFRLQGSRVTRAIAGVSNKRRDAAQRARENASSRRGELIHPPSITRSWGACRSPHARQNSAMRCGPCPWAAK